MVKQVVKQKLSERNTLRQKAEKKGIAYSTIKDRARRMGKDHPDLLSGCDMRKTMIRHNGRRMTMTDWAKHYGVCKSTFCSVVRKHGRRWAFRFYDNHGKRKIPGCHSVFVDFKGRRMTINDLAIITGVPLSLIRDRAYDGITGDRLCSRDLLNRRYMRVRGRRQSVSDWARESGLSVNAMHQRIRRNGECAEAVDMPMKRSKNECWALESELASLGIVY